jgi:hypothetical protein
MDAFAAYLAREVVRVGPIEIFACWDGEQQAPCERRRLIHPGDLRAPTFFFTEKETLRVTADPMAGAG